MMPANITIKGLTIDLRNLPPNATAAMFTDYDPNNENATAAYPYHVTKQINLEDIKVLGKEKWMIFRNQKLFDKTKISGKCPGPRTKK